MKRITQTILTAVIACFVLASCSNKAPEQAGGIVMDTVFSITVYGEPGLAEELLDAGSELDEKVLSRFSDDSLLSEYSSGISAEPGPAVISGTEINLSDILEKSERLRYDSAGMFDVRIGALSDLWDIGGRMNGDENSVPPAPDLIKKALEDRSVYDLGGVGKGIYLDMAFDILERSDAQAAVVSAGGSVLVYGAKPGGSDFKVAITDPFRPESSGEPFATINLDGGYFISTSGSYERYFDHDGERYHHILNPLNGYPAWCAEDAFNRSGLEVYLLSSPGEMPESVPVSVTIISKSGFYSDALSTACFVLGPDMGLPLAQSYDSEAVFIMSDGKVVVSDGIIIDEAEKTITLR